MLGTYRLVISQVFRLGIRIMLAASLRIVLHQKFRCRRENVQIDRLANSVSGFPGQHEKFHRQADSAVAVGYRVEVLHAFFRYRKVLAYNLSDILQADFFPHAPVDANAREKLRERGVPLSDHIGIDGFITAEQNANSAGVVQDGAEGFQRFIGQVLCFVKDDHAPRSTQLGYNAAFDGGLRA